MQNFNLPELLQTGTYEIRNLVNGKVYLGSTAENFKERWNHHRSQLRKGCHKNTHLQRAWNKYTEDNFVFNVLEFIDVCCTLDAEQVLLDNIDEKYNINPLATGTPNMSQETIDKRSATFRITIREAMDYYQRIKNGEIELADVPEKYLKMVSSRIGFKVWNDGLTGADIDYSYLKVPKTITEKLKEAHKNTAERIREKTGRVYVYDKDFNYLGEFRSSKDLEEWSLTEENNFPVNSRFKGEFRMGIPSKFLSSCNITISCKTLKPYKSLYFRKEPITEIINNLK